jgi:hypothetical protein
VSPTTWQLVSQFLQLELHPSLRRTRPQEVAVPAPVTLRMDKDQRPEFRVSQE